MLHRTKNCHKKTRVQIHSEEEHTSGPLKGRTDFRPYRGKTCSESWEEYVLAPTEGLTDIGSHIWKNKFHITHREKQVSDPT